MSETISGIITVRTLVEKAESEIGYVDYTNKKTVKLWTLKENRVYKIPGYQREIRWSPKYVKNLLEDIRMGSKLLGNILVSTSDESVYEIIDGQQRITVIMMILEKLKRVRTQECVSLDICQLINETFPLFYKAMEMDFLISDSLDKSEKAQYYDNDILDQRETLYALWNCISNYIDALKEDDRDCLEEALLDSEINIIITKVDATKRQSRKVCVDYFIDINNKSEPLEPIDILKAYAFREHFDEAAKKWIEIQKNEKALRVAGIHYPKKDLFLHYMLCSVNKGLEYQVTKISDNFQLQSDVTLSDGKNYLKGTDIEVLITDKRFYRNMLDRIIKFQEFINVILRSKTEADQGFIDCLNKGNIDIHFNTISGIFYVLTAVLRGSDIVPKLLIMKYFLDVILNDTATSTDYKIIFPINVLVTCFSAGNANLKVRAAFSNIVLKKDWMESVNKKFNTEIKSFPKKVKFGREVQFMGKSTKTSGEYLAKRIAAIAASYKMNGRKYVFDEGAFKAFNMDPHINAEHFFINQSGVVSINYNGSEIMCPYPAKLRNKISYLSNYLMMDVAVNKDLGTGTVREKITQLGQFIANNPGKRVFGDGLSEQLFVLMKDAFQQTKCPTEEQIAACQDQEEAKQLIINYYENDFLEEFQGYLQAIEENLNFSFPLKTK